MGLMKRLSILGSTGSIGRNVLEIVRRFPDRFVVKALAAKGNVGLLAQQVMEFLPETAVVFDRETAGRLKAALSGVTVEILFGEEGYQAAASRGDADMMIGAMMGAAGLKPTLAAIESGKEIALANKETLVMAGELVMRKALEKGVKILPIDSEHSAIFQCLSGQRGEDVDTILLTASGGPFLHLPRSAFSQIKPEDALKHPNWVMGQKITIDSATLMNKGLEVIEARWLFGLPYEQIRVIVHPQSIIHSMVAFRDGSVIAQLGVPDMKGAIAYAMSYPERLPLDMPIPDFAALGSLTFEEPDLDRFECLALAFRACQSGGTLPAVMNAANEMAVAAFLDRKISFTGIPKTVRDVMDCHDIRQNPGVDDILKADQWARETALDYINPMGH
jgi:1-deoxy-D-xylulose-5-phosphate reductoisomerase